MKPAVFTREVYVELLDAVEEASTSASKGRALEEASAYLFSCVPGYLDMERNALNSFGAEELDIAVIHSSLPDGLGFLPNLILVECKNVGSPVDSKEVGAFVRRVKNRGCEVGVLISASGITGQDKGNTAANFEVSVAQATDGIRILVVTLSDLRRVKRVQDFVTILRRRLLQVVAHGTYLHSELPDL